MLKISRVDTVDDQTLDIELSNGHLILFSMKSLLKTDPAYQALSGQVPFPRPKTDGLSILWKNGPKLALEDILAMLKAQENE